MDGTILRETLQAVLPESVIKPLAARLGVVERARKREILKLVYSLVLSAGSDDSGVLAEATAGVAFEYVAAAWFSEMSVCYMQGPARDGEPHR